ncbi:MAG: hypothetical protein JSS11_01675 [Verrucomicrobia bacterium]|nr:hypothetical protein [Verrucomicrobiota bacterium]
MRHLTLSLLVLATFFTGCVLPLDPAWSEDRPVQIAHDSTKTVTVIEGMVFYNGLSQTRGLRFPPGTYTLEAEDAQYYYLRSPAPLEFRTFANGQSTDGRDIPGGIMIAKQFNLIPGGGYIDGDKGQKVAIWKLGSEFLRIEGRYWTKSF